MASTTGSEEMVEEQNVAEDDGLGNHSTFHGSEPQLQFTSPPFQPPPTAEQLDQMFRPNRPFQQGLLGTRDSTYIETFVLLLSWEEQDLRLPVDLEIDRLSDMFDRVYHFKVERWKIPSEDPHQRLNKKIIEFVRFGNDRRECLKIVYYAGHGKLSRNRQPMWTE
jgi:hypothetical protein